MNAARSIVLAAAVIFSTPARAGPVQWCDPASPLFDPSTCYNESGPHRGYGCDPFGPAYDPNYCAALGSRPQMSGHSGCGLDHRGVRNSQVYVKKAATPLVDLSRPHFAFSHPRLGKSAPSHWMTHR
jgi:hypothetical protein